MGAEAKIEAQLKKIIKSAGGLCWKFTSPGTAGVPDRIVICKGKIAFVELKAPGEKPRSLQRERAKQLRRSGAHVYCISTTEQAQRFAREFKRSRYPKENDYDDI